MYTTYFANIRNLPDDIVPVAICVKVPAGFSGINYTKLAPSYSILSEYKKSHDEDRYIRRYKAEILDNLDLYAVYQEILSLTAGKDFALVCYEKSGDFCHRSLAAQRFREFGFEIEEFDKSAPVKEKTSLFGITEGIICQQVNCCGVMNAGLAKEIAIRFPHVKQNYIDMYKWMKEKSSHKYPQSLSCPALLGTSQLIPIDKPYCPLSDNFTQDYADFLQSRLMVCNIYSQLEYGNPAKTGRIYTYRQALIASIKKKALKYPHFSVYIPKGIGCGFGGENWESLKADIQNLNLPNLYFLDTRTCEIEKASKEAQAEREL